VVTVCKQEFMTTKDVSQLCLIDHFNLSTSLQIHRLAIRESMTISKNNCVTIHSDLWLWLLMLQCSITGLSCRLHIIDINRCINLNNKTAQ